VDMEAVAMEAAAAVVKVAVVDMEVEVAEDATMMAIKLRLEAEKIMIIVHSLLSCIVLNSSLLPLKNAKLTPTLRDMPDIYRIAEIFGRNL